MKFVVDVTAPLGNGSVPRSARRAQVGAAAGGRTARAQPVLVYRRVLGVGGEAGRARGRLGRSRGQGARARAAQPAASTGSTRRSTSSSPATPSRCSRRWRERKRQFDLISSIRRRSRSPRARRFSVQKDYRELVEAAWPWPRPHWYITEFSPMPPVRTIASAPPMQARNAPMYFLAR